MAAYAAVISLKHTINGLLNSSLISLSPFARECLNSAYDEAILLQKFLEKLNSSISSSYRRERLDGLEGKIRDSANKLEDFLEFHELELLDEQVRQEITSFGETLKMMEKDYIEDLSRDGDDDEEDAASFWSNDDFDVEMVGNSTLFTSTQRYLLSPMRPDDTYAFMFFGGKGSGGTAIANTIFEDVRNGRFIITFDCWAWVTIGKGLGLKQVLISIIAQISNRTEADYDFLNMEEDEILRIRLFNALNNRRYMIVLDDVDDVEMVNYLIKSAFPEQSNGSLVFVITITEELAQTATVHMTPWHGSLFRELMSNSFHQLFYNDMPHYQPEFEVAANNIIDNCRFSIISAVKTILFLLKSDKTVELWSNIAADKENPIFIITNEILEISKIKMELQHFKGSFGEVMSQWVAYPAEVEILKSWIHPKRFFSRMVIKSFFGMAGIGKTTFARRIFKEELIRSHFDHSVWVTLGPQYQTEEILIDILAQIYPDIDKLLMKGDGELVRELCVQLSCKRFLIILDDLYSKEPLLHLKSLFPEIKGVVLVTTRLAKVAKFERDDTDFEMKLLDKEESWCLLHRKVFGGELAPIKFEKAGRVIAEKCDGLPLMILTVADQLLKAEISEEYWNHVASDKDKSVFENAHHLISNALLPSYESIPQYLKSCFHYIGVFRERYEISTSNLTNLLIAEGFLEPNPSQMEEEFVAECLNELVDRSLVMVQRKVSDSQIKTCRLSSVFWHLSRDQAMKNKFFHAMNRYDDCSIESMESQRRICIQNGILLGFKDVQNSMANNRSTNTHTLLCASSLQQYPVPLYFDMRLLRVMNVVTIRLYEFPVEVVNLLHLRYLGVTCNGELPTSISNLQKLQYLIVKRYMIIKSSADSSLLPLEIWDMSELRHLQITGGCLPDHKCETAGLVKLSTLLDVSAEICREEVLKWIPNLKRLGIRIELEPDDDGKSFSYLNNIHHLHILESLKCVVVNPEINSEVFSPPAPVLMFPPSLRKVSLSGLGYSWKHMKIIGKLKNLEVLKLKCFAFQGPEWEMGNIIQFEKLKFLLLQDSDIVQWRAMHQATSWGVVIKLDCLCIKHCYGLKELPTANHVGFLNKIHIVNCDPLTVTWAEQTGQLMQAHEVNVHRSWVAKSHQE